MYQKFLKLLEENRKTAYKVCKATGICQATFTYWKQGRYTPKLTTLKKIADYFGISVTYFLE